MYHHLSGIHILTYFLLWGSVVCFRVPAVRKVLKEQYLEAPVGVPQVSHEEWDELLRENLLRDVAPWQARGPLLTEDVLRQHQAILAEGLAPEVFQLILIYNNRIYYPNRTDVDCVDNPAEHSPAGVAFHRKVTALLSSGRRTLPNALFVFSFEDNRPRYCSPTSKLCERVPMFSQFKTVGEPDGDDLDILVPQWLYTPNSLYFYPWHLKEDRAFFRGEPFCSGYWVGPYYCHDACPRVGLAQLSQNDRDAGNDTVLDVGLVMGVEKVLGPDGNLAQFRCLKRDLPAYPRVPIPEHSYYKWLLHMEGISASSRLSQLLMINSVVVMQRQAFLEYFYRSLKPFVHVVPFFNDTAHYGSMDDIYGVIAKLREMDATDPESVQRIIREAQNFALKFTMPLSRFQYLKDALTAYRTLFSDMDSFIESYVEGLRRRGFNIK